MAFCSEKIVDESSQQGIKLSVFNKPLIISRASLFLLELKAPNSSSL
jgi:hypothetical protein